MAARNPFLDGALRVLRQVATRALERSTRTAPRKARPSGGPKARPGATFTEQPRRPEPGAVPDGYPGDFRGRPEIVYQPHNDRRADPGEVVWTWVPFEEDHSKGKDRPVLLIGRDGPWLLGLQVTSQDHDRDAEQEARAGRFWIDIGVGGWDSQQRPSEARVNRIIRIDPDRVRRIGAVLAEGIFREVADEVLRFSKG